MRRLLWFLLLWPCCFAQDANPKKPDLRSLIGKPAYLCADSPLFTVARLPDGTLEEGEPYKLFLPQRELKIAEVWIDRQTPTEYSLLFLLKAKDKDTGIVLWSRLNKSEATKTGEPLHKAALGDLAAPRFSGSDLDLARDAAVRRGMSYRDVHCLKGVPDRTVSMSRPDGEAWYYDNQGLTIYFDHGEVDDIVSAN